jgi:hypothetical protein
MPSPVSVLLFVQKAKMAGCADVTVLWDTQRDVRAAMERATDAIGAAVMTGHTHTDRDVLTILSVRGHSLQIQGVSKGALQL